MSRDIINKGKDAKMKASDLIKELQNSSAKMVAVNGTLSLVEPSGTYSVILSTERQM